MVKDDSKLIGHYPFAKKGTAECNRFGAREERGTARVWVSTS